MNSTSIGPSGANHDGGDDLLAALRRIESRLERLERASHEPHWLVRLGRALDMHRARSSVRGL